MVVCSHVTGVTVKIRDRQHPQHRLPTLRSPKKAQSGPRLTSRMSHFIVSPPRLFPLKITALPLLSIPSRILNIRHIRGGYFMVTRISIVNAVSFALWSMPLAAPSLVLEVRAS